MGHISYFDTSPYGHIGDCIEKLDDSKLAKLLEEVARKGQSDQVNISKGGKTLLDLALDNLEIVPPDKLKTAQDILNALLASEAIDANKSFKDKGKSHFFLSHLIDLIAKTSNPQLKDYLVSKIDENVLVPEKLSKLKPTEFDRAIKVLRDNNKAEFADKAVIINAVKKGNYELVEEIARTKPELLQTKTSKGANLLKAAALKNHFGIQQLLIAKGVSADFQLKIEKKKTNYLGNLIYDSANPGAIALIDVLIDNKKIEGLLNDEHIKAIYSGMKKHPPVVGFESIFNKLLDKGFLNIYLGVKLESAGIVSGADFRITDYALKNLDLPKLKVLLQADQLNFARLKPEYKIRVIELFSKNYNELHEAKSALQKQILNSAVELNQWDSLRRLLKDGHVNPNELGNDEEHFAGLYKDQISQVIKIFSENCDKLQGADDNLRKEILTNAVELKEWDALDALLKAGVVDPNHLGEEEEQFADLTDEQRAQVIILFGDNPEKLKGIKASYKKEILDNAVEQMEWGALDALLKADIVDPKDLGDNAEIVLKAYLDGELEDLSGESLVKLMKVNMAYALKANFVVLDNIQSAGFTMLHAVVLNKDTDILDELLEVENVQALLKKETKLEQTPLAIAQDLGDEEILIKLINKGSALDQVKKVGKGLAMGLFGPSVQITEPLRVALEGGKLAAALEVVSAESYKKLGITIKDTYVIYDLLMKNIANEQYGRIFDEIIKKGLFPLDLKAKKEALAIDFAQKMIQANKPQLLGELVAYLAKTIESDKIELKALENASGANINELKKKFETNIEKNSKYLANIAGLISKSEKFKDNKGAVVKGALVAFSEAVLKVKDNSKNEFAPVFVKAMVDAKHYEALAELKSANKERASLIDPELVSKVMKMPDKGSRLFTLNNPQGKDLLNILLDYSSKEEVNKMNEEGLTMLHYACRNGQVALAKKLFAKEADPFAHELDTDMTALMMLAVSDQHQQAAEIFDNFVNGDKASGKPVSENEKKIRDAFVKTLKENSGLLEKSEKKGKAVVEQKPVEYMHIMLALKNGNVELANAFIKALKPQKPGKDNRIGPDKYKADKAEFKKVRAQILTNVLYRAVHSDDTELVSNMLKMQQSKDFNPEYIKLSINKGGKVERFDINPLFIALRSNNIPMLDALLTSQNKHVDLNSVDGSSVSQYSLLQEAMLDGRAEVVQMLLDLNDKTTNPDRMLKLDDTIEQDGEKLTPISLAYNKILELTSNIEDAKNELKVANTSQKKTEKEKVIQDAEKAISGIYDTMGLLLEYNQGKEGDPNKRVDINASLTVKQKGKEENKPKFNIITDSYQRLMNERTKGEDASQVRIKQLEDFILRILLINDVDLNITNEYGQNLLMLACQQGDAQVVGAVALSNRAPNVNQVDYIGNTALIYTAQSGNTGLYRYLIDEGAKHVVNKDGMSVLMTAANGGHLGIVELIKPTHKDMTVKDKAGNTALHYLVTNSTAFKTEGDNKREEREKILDKFISLGADINAQNSKGETPLILAILSGDVQLVKKLIECGADVNLADREGNTPLIYASLLNDRFLLEALLENNSLQVNQKNNDGVSAYIIAAARQGLESWRSANLQQKEGEAPQAEVPDLKDLSRVIEKNNYPQLPAVLISRGADPYESDPNPFLHNVAKTIMKSAALSVANNYAFQASPIAKEIGTSMNALYTSRAIFKTVEEKTRTSVRDYFNANTKRDMRVDISDKVMIGSFHNKGVFSRIIYGESLHGAINSHSNFRKGDDKGGDVGGIYTKESLDRLVRGDKQKDAPWQYDIHKMLSYQYVNLVETINKRPWYYKFPIFWKTMALNRIAKEILEADECLLKDERKCNINKQNIDFEAASSQLLEVMTSPKSSLMLMKYILENPSEPGQGVEAIIKAVVNGDILVRPETFVVFLKFSQQLVELQHNDIKKDAFLKANKKELSDSFKSRISDFANSFTVAADGVLSKLGRFTEKGKDVAERARQANQNVANEQEGQEQVPLRQKFISNLAYYSGQTEEDIVNKTAKTASMVMGVASAGAAAMAVDNKIYKALGAAGAAVTLLPVGAIAATVAGGATVMASGFAIGAAAKWLYNSMLAWKSKAVEEEPEEILVPQTVAEASKLESRTQDLLEGNLKCEDIVHEENFDIRPSPQLEVSLSSPQAKPALLQMASASPIVLTGVSPKAIVQQQVIEASVLSNPGQKTATAISRK